MSSECEEVILEGEYLPCGFNGKYIRDFTTMQKWLKVTGLTPVKIEAGVSHPLWLEGYFLHLN